MRDTAVPVVEAGSDELRIDAPHRELLDQVLDKWSLSVLKELCERPCRFNELRRAIPQVTQKSLTATLRRLERNGKVRAKSALNQRLRDALRPTEDALQALGMTAERSLPEITALFAQMVGLLMLGHTGRIRMFRQAPADLFATYLDGLVARARA